jgi:adenylate cyclase
MSLSRRLVPVGAGLALVLALLGLRAEAPAPFERLRQATFDSFQRLSPRVPQGDVVRVVDIDEESLRRHGQWPWPRHVVADLVAALQDLDAGVIALDMVFAEPDRTSPALLVPDWERRFGFRAAGSREPLPDHDAILAAVFARGRVVAGFVPTAEPGAAPLPRSAGFATIDGDPRLTAPYYPGAVPNLPILDAAAAGHGGFSVSAGSDEINRRLQLLAVVGDRLVPSLALDALRVMQDEETFKVRAERDGATLTGYTIRVGAVDLAVDATGALALHFPTARSTPTIPAWELLDPERRAGLRGAIQGRAVFVGTSALGLSDLRPTPMTAFEPGVNLHAMGLDQALAGHALIRPAWALGAEVVAALLLGLAAALACGFARLRSAGLGIAFLAPVPAFAAVALFARGGLLLDPILPTLGLLVAHAGGSLVRYAGSERSAQRLRAAFTHYLSPDLVAVLASDPGRLKLGGESREMTFLFTDLEGFTAMTEASGAEALVALLNAYLDGMCSIAMAHGGTVDKIVGDAVHVMFNAPLDQPDHAERAVACALALDAFAEAFRQDQRAGGVPFGATRIGINTGRAVVGNFGGTRRFDYTAHGDAINTAARLESANKALGTRICVARATCDQVAGVGFRPIGTLMLKGKSVGVEVFEPVRAGAEAPDAYREAFGRLVRGEAGGAEALLRLHEADPHDPILALHARRIRAGERSVSMAA